jgi:hypothetical protein
MQLAHSGGSWDSCRHARRGAKLQPIAFDCLQHCNVRSFLCYASSPRLTIACRYEVEWTPPPLPLSSNFSASFCVVVYDDDTMCTNSSIGLVSPAICLPLYVPVAQPRWSAASDAQRAAANGTFPIFLGTVGCRSFFVAAAEDQHYDVVVRPGAKLPPGVSIFSRKAVLCDAAAHNRLALTSPAGIAPGSFLCSRRTMAAKVCSMNFASRHRSRKQASSFRKRAPCC